jgi:hypothetical protein
MYKSIAVSPRLQLLPLLASALLAILGLASVYIYTGAAFTLVANSHPCLMRALCFNVSKSTLPIRSFNRESHLFSSFRNLILA